MARLAARYQNRNALLNKNELVRVQINTPTNNNNKATTTTTTNNNNNNNVNKQLSMLEKTSLKYRILAMPGKRFTQFHNIIASTFSSGNKTTTTTTKEDDNTTTTKKQCQHDPNNSSVRFAYSVSNITPRKRKRAPFECVICLNNFTRNIPHCTDKCDHNICRTCIRQYFQNSLNQHQDSYETIQCPSPDCKECFITDQVLYQFFSKSEVKKWWNAAIIKSFISNKVNCPMCEAVFDADSCLLKKCTYARCYGCDRGLCITCQKPWHPGQVRFIDDEEQLKLTLKRAKDNNWTRCPNCLTIVEKITGCTTIYCKCRTTFCYRCGGISDNHTCRNQCQTFNTEKLRSIRNPMFAIEKKPNNN